MSIAVIVRALVTAGASPEMILAAVEAAEAEHSSAIEVRRAKDAERQRRHRARRNVTSRDVTVTERDTPPDGPLPPPHTPPPSPLNPPKPSLRSERAPAAPDPIEEDFAAFWAAYPRREGSNPRQPALTAYRRARKSASAGVLLDGAQRYARQTAGTERRYIAQASTWLNQRRWEDEPASAVSSSPQAQQVEPDEWRELRRNDPPGWPENLPPREVVATAYRRGIWNAGWGGEPQMSSCRLPAAIKRDLLVERFGRETAIRSYGHLFDPAA